MYVRREINSKLREKLQTETESRLSYRFYEEFRSIEEKAYENWVPLMNHDRGSHNGPKHLTGVEEQINYLLEKIAEIEFSPVECFILLCSILFHDVGKIVERKAAINFLDHTNVKRSILRDILTEIIKAGKKNRGAIAHHGIISAAFILAKHEELGFGDFGIAECVAIVSAAHDLNTAKELKGRYMIKDRFLDLHGRIHLASLCALLTLGDELDNSYQRAMSPWVKSLEKGGKGKEKGRLRARVSGCEIIRCGKLLVLHLHRELYEPYLKEAPDRETRKTLAKDNHLYHVWKDLLIKREILGFWGDSLRKMHIDVIDVALNLNGYLLSPKEANDRLELTVELESGGSSLTSLEGKHGLQKVTVKPGYALLHINPKKFDESLGAIEKKLKHDSWYVNLNAFQLAVEPNIRLMKLDRLLKAAIELRFKSFGFQAFPWETLATEAGFDRLDEVRLIFHRLVMLSDIFFCPERELGKELLLQGLRLLEPDMKPPSEGNLVLTDLDCEWSLNVESCDGSSKISREDTKKIVSSFCQWTSNIVTRRVNSDLKSISEGQVGSGGVCGVPSHMKNEEMPRPCITIGNEELSYLLDEFKKDEKILLSKVSDSCVYEEDAQESVGVNLLITGPAGVGKSTLAMEFLGKNTFDDFQKRVCAYYSLEQPIESIRRMAKEMGVNNILDFFSKSRPAGIPYSYRETLLGLLSDSTLEPGPVLLLPKLAPRTYGPTADDERLFWFRYRQISRLLEANRELDWGRLPRQWCLGSIVIDNLNAFARTPLARQQIHQLFRLVSWYGILGIHIIENNPSREFSAFQTEVEFLADIVIRLGWAQADYQYKFIEIAKSRCQKHVLGKHPFKIGPRGATRGESHPNWLDITKEEELPAFEIFPSIHTQVSRSEKKPLKDETGSEKKDADFSTNGDLKKLVHKSPKGEETGIARNAFIMLQGKSGGHKLAIGMSYIHAKRWDGSAMVINLGQPIDYSAVADECSWWDEAQLSPAKIEPFQKRLKWKRSAKVEIDLYPPPGIELKLEQNCVKPPPGNGVVYILNFHAGFLLPEEFLQIVKKYIEDIEQRGLPKIGRVLFNSTAHLPERYPLLDKNPFVLHALVTILKRKGIGLMIIGVKGIGNDERVMGLAAMADLKVSLFDVTDERLPDEWKEQLRKPPEEGQSNIRVISSDNVTGKDYSKRYRLLKVEEQKFIITNLDSGAEDDKSSSS